MMLGKRLGIMLNSKKGSWESFKGGMLRLLMGLIMSRMRLFMPY